MRVRGPPCHPKRGAELLSKSTRALRRTTRLAERALSPTMRGRRCRRSTVDGGGVSKARRAGGRLVCRERRIVRGDEGRIMTRPSSRPEARRRLGCQIANELGAPVASSIPEQLPGHEPASARMGYEDGHALFLRYRRVEGPLGRGGAA